MIENDTAIIGKLVYRHAYGKLNTKDRKIFLELLNKTVHNRIDSTQTILLNFIYKEMDSSINYLASRKLINFFRKPKNKVTYNQFFITEKGFKAKSKKINLYEDVYDLLPRLFFKYRFRYAGYVIIAPNGKYFRHYGEYYIPSVLKQLKREFSN